MDARAALVMEILEKKRSPACAIAEMAKLPPSPPPAVNESPRMLFPLPPPPEPPRLPPRALSSRPAPAPAPALEPLKKAVAKTSRSPGPSMPSEEEDESSSGVLRWVPPSVPGDDPVFEGELAEQLLRLVLELKHVEHFLAAGIDPPNRFLFVGPSGVGKTLAARWIGRELGLPVAILDVSACVSKWLGETSHNLSGALKSAQERRAVLFLDEVDGAVQKRGDASGDSGRALERATSALLQGLDWLPPTQIVMAATNLPEKLDDALRRRLPLELRFAPPSRGARALMVDRWLARTTVPAEERAQLVDRTEGLSGALLRAEAMKLGRVAVLQAAGAHPKSEPTRDLAGMR